MSEKLAIELAAIRKILVVRNDKLGDFTLALPTFTLLKQCLPQAEVSALVPNYTRELAERSPWIDRVLIDPGKGNEIALWREIRRQRFDVAISLFSTTRIAAVLKMAGIPYRLAPATKIAQFLYNHRLVQRRSRSEKPEFEYNIDLARHFLSNFGILPQPTLPRRPYLTIDWSQVAAARHDFCVRHGVTPQRALVFLHPGSGGSANNLSLKQYAQLAQQLRSRAGHVIVITSGPGEEELGSRLAGALSHVPHVHHISRAGLSSFLQTLAFCDLFISGSTGPLHLAGALDRPTAGFYPRRRSSTSLRWQTLNSPEHRLAFYPPEDAGEEAMEKIDIETAASEISSRFLDAH